MSTSTQPPASAVSQHRSKTTLRGPEALALFDELLFENPEICSSCFCKIRDRTEHDTNTLGTGNRPAETLERAGSGTVGYDSHDLDAYGARQKIYARTFCGECGSPGGRDEPQRIRSLQQLRGDCDRIVRRLHELGYYPDVATLYRVAESLKTNPDRQGPDREILAASVALAIERGSERTEGTGGLERPGPRPDCERRSP